MNIGQATILFSTITQNEANRTSSSLEPRLGGGITDGGSAGGASLTIGSSILAGNSDNRSKSDPDFAPDCHALSPFNTTSRGNVIGILNANCAIKDPATGSLLLFDQKGSPDLPLDPKLELPHNNGGPTDTYALKIGSPALDRAWVGTACPKVDQRHFVRPRDGNGDGAAKCDVGAFEANSIPAPVDDLKDGPNG